MPELRFVIMTKSLKVVYKRDNLLAAKRYATKRGYVRVGVLDADGFLVRIWYKGHVTCYGTGMKPLWGEYIRNGWGCYTPGRIKPIG